MADKNMNRSAQVTLNGSGYGAVRLAPTGGKQWRIDYLTVRTSSNVKEATATIYDNQIGPGYVRDSSITGSTGDTTDTVINVLDGYAIWVEWQNGDAGATATVTYSGEEF